MIICAKYLMTGDGKTVLEDKAVLTKDGKIEKIASKEELTKAYPEEEVKDYGEATLLPGLCDMHAHLGYYYSQPDTFNYGPQLIMLYALQHAQSAFERGITSVRDMSSAHGVCKNLKLAAEKGFVKIPRITHTDTGICMTGGHGWRDGREADGPDECRKAAREQLKAGATWIKVMATGGVMTKGVEPGSPQLTEEELRAAIEEAHKAGAKSFTHAQGMTGIKNALRAGVDSIEHGFFMDDWCFDFMKEHNVFFVPTLAAPYWIKVNGTAAGIPDYMVRKVENTIEAHQDTFRRAHKAGVKIALGTDAGTPFNKYDLTCYECVLMVENGMTPMEAIQCGTINAAELMSVDATHGSITPGKRANFAIFEKDPLEDIHALLNCAMTVIGGEVVFEK